MKVHLRIFAIPIFLLAMIIIIHQALRPIYAAGPWYVAPGGVDGNDCLSPATPCATINGALNKPGFVPGDTINVAVGTYTGTGDEVVLLDKDATLSGGWNIAFTTINGVSVINGQDTRMGIRVYEDVAASLNSFTIENSFSSGDGGGIHNSGDLILNDVRVSGNTVGSSNGAGIYSTGSLHLNECTIANNISDGGAGGGIYNTGLLTATNSAIANNIAFSGGGMSNYGSTYLDFVSISTNEGGGIFNGIDALLNVHNSSVHNNSKSGSYVYGGGIKNTRGIINLINSTVSSNEVLATSFAYGGGISSETGGSITLKNSTVTGNIVTGNFSSIGGGVYITPSSIMFFENTIIANNTTAGTGPDCGGSADKISLGHNIIEDISDCTLMLTASDLISTSARLASLEGSPGYHPLLFGSLAINGGNPAGCTDHLGNLLTTDQRGVARVDRCDIGAYEYDGEIFNTSLPIVFNNYCPPAFVDDFSNPGSGWPIADNGVLYEYLNGEYRILVKSPDTFAGASPGVKATDFTVSVDVRSGPNHILPGPYGLLFGLSDDWTQFYTFEILTEAERYWLWKYESDAWTLLAEGFYEQEDSNQLKIVRAGIQIDAYINDQLMVTISDGSFTGPRRLGLMATTNPFEGGTEGFFDNFTICGASDFTANFIAHRPINWVLEEFMMPVQAGELTNRR